MAVIITAVSTVLFCFVFKTVMFIDVKDLLGLHFNRLSGDLVIFAVNYIFCFFSSFFFKTVCCKSEAWKFEVHAIMCQNLNVKVRPRKLNLAYVQLVQPTPTSGVRPTCVRRLVTPDQENGRKDERPTDC